MKNIKTLLLEDAAYYDAQMGEIKLKLWAAELEEFSPDEVERAMKAFRGEKNRRQMPMPSDLKSKLNQAVDPDYLAQEAAARVISAIGKCGYINPEGARAYIGELGWNAVSRFGSWDYICRSVGDTMDQTTLFAQLKNLCKSQIHLSEAGLLNKPIGLPETQKKLLESNGVRVAGLIGKSLNDEIGWKKE